MGITPVIGTHAARLAAGHAKRLWKESDTGLIYLDDGAAWQIWKGDGHVRKTSDETVNNSSTMQNDDHLLIPVEANEIWLFEFRCFINTASGTPHWNAGVYGPAGAAVNMWANTNDFNTAQAASLIGNTFNFPTIAGVTAARIWGRLTNGATPGNFGLRWAQTTPTAENTQVLINSVLLPRRIA